MRVTKLVSDKIVTLRTSKYIIDWEKDGNSSLEKMFRDLIHPFWTNYIVLFQPRIPGSLLKLDFLNVNKKLVVEIDGEQHGKFNAFFHNKSRANYLSSIKRDLEKEKWCERNSIKLLRLNEEDLQCFSLKYIQKKFGISLV